jgi:hypothetical protein
LPIEKIQLKQVVLQDNFPVQLKDRNIRLTASVSGTALQAQATLQADQDTQLSLNFNSPDAQHATAELVGNQGTEEILRTQFDLQPDRLSGAINLLLQPVNALFLRPFTAESTIPIPEGSLDSTFSLPLPLQQDAALQAALTVSDSNNHQIHLEASGTPDTRQASLLLTGKKGQQEFLKTNLTMEDQRISGTYSLHAKQLRSFLAPYLPSPLPAISGTLSGTLDIPLPAHQEKGFKAKIAASSLALPTLSTASAQVSLAGKVNKNGLQLGQTSTFRASKLAFGKTRIDECSLDLAGDFSRQGEQVLLHFAKKQKIRIKSLKTGSTFIRELLLQPAEALGFALNLQNKAWSFGKNTLHSSPLVIRTGSVNIATGPLRCSFSALRCTNAGPEIITELSSPTLIVTTSKAEVPLKNIAGHFQFQQRIIKSKLQGEPELVPGTIQAELQHDLSGSAGFFTLRTDKRLDLHSEEVRLSALLSKWPFPYDLNKGSVHLQTKGEWKAGQKFHLSLLTEIKDGNGYFQKNLFEGLDTHQDLVLLPALRSQSPGTIALDKIIGGIDIQNIRAKTRLVPARTGKKPILQLNDLQAELLQGTMSSREIRYDLNKQASHFTVNVKSLDLATMVELMKVKDMEASGTISGKIPVTIEGKKVSVDKGALYNDPPGGGISYAAPDAHLTGLSEYALKAIKDFRYTALQSTAQYDPSGQLVLGVSLQGVSPEIDSRRPVHFNINIEQNLNALLQGLRYSKGLSEKIDKRVQERYK